MSLPPINIEVISRRIVERLRWYIRDHAKRKCGVIGVSGGVDSAATLALLVRALGPEDTYCLILPSDSTPERDIEDAKKLIRLFEIPEESWEEIPIDPIVSAFEEKLGSLTDVERGNIKARVRMTILYQRAYRLKGLVVGTGDRSEILIGYFTKYGDGGVDILPLGGLYKTYVRQLAKYLGVPAEIADKPSSPALWKGQTAATELGLDYDKIDPILHYRFDKWMKPEEIAEAAGVPERTVEEILRRVEVTEHKRLPPEIFKLELYT